MSASIAIAHGPHYKDQVKLVRAATAASWFAGAVRLVVDAFTEPLSPEFDMGPAPKSRDFPAFHC